jgi:hypothetical protein
MDFKSYTVRFATVMVGATEQTLTTFAPHLDSLFARFGENLPEIAIDGDHFQIRDLQKIGSVWMGVFARLKVDAPHKVDAHSKEHKLNLNKGDRILEKCYFIYRSASNVLTWQNNRNVSSLTKLQLYLNQLLSEYVSVNICMNESALDAILQRDVYEVQFNYARPNLALAGAPKWAQADFDRMKDLDGASSKFLIRAERGGRLSKKIGNFIKQAMSLEPVDKVRVKLTDETDVIDLFLAPIKESIRVLLVGQYPDKEAVYQALEDAHHRAERFLPKP